MKKWSYITVILVAAAVGAFALWTALLPPSKVTIDTVNVNMIQKTVEENYDQIAEAGDTWFTQQPDTIGSTPFSVLDASGICIAKTSDKASTSLNEAIKRGDIILDVLATDGGVPRGKILIYSGYDEMLASYQKKARIISIGILLLMLVFVIALVYRLNRKVVQPFRKMERFAIDVAQGKLDAPLEMDKENAFGAFTESFDLMRTELKAAQEREAAANRSKRELVASLSHDIKTPVASIKAVSELMSARAADEADREKLMTITGKADQIDGLVGNLFTATLEELEELAVEVGEVQSGQIRDMILASDYRSMAGAVTIPDCIVKADPVRLAQIIDNVFANAYKYAGTAMTVGAQIADGYLLLTFADEGPGADEGELPLLTQKYYRGRGAKAQTGAGLGLYICLRLAERMGGGLTCSNAAPPAHGFVVTLSLALA